MDQQQSTEPNIWVAVYIWSAMIWIAATWWLGATDEVAGVRGQAFSIMAVGGMLIYGMWLGLALVWWAVKPRYFANKQAKDDDLKNWVITDIVFTLFNHRGKP